jgi:hypothetical protein
MRSILRIYFSKQVQRGWRLSKEVDAKWAYTRGDME